MNKKSTSILIALVGVFLFSTKAIVAKLMYARGIVAETSLVFRMGLSLPFFILIGWYKKAGTDLVKFPVKDHLKIILLGTLGYYLASYFDFKGLEYISAGLERLIVFSYPTLVVILSALFLKKKIAKSQLIAISITYLGIIIVFADNTTNSVQSNFWLGGTLVFMSALTYAMYLVGSGELLSKMSSITFTTYSMIVSSICILVHFFFTNSFEDLKVTGEVWALAIYMALFCTVIPTYMISEAIKRVDASTVSIIASVGPVLTITLSNVILDEQMGISEVIGAILIIGSVAWISLKKG